MIMTEGCRDIDVYVRCGLEWGATLILQSLQGQKAEWDLEATSPAVDHNGVVASPHL